MSILDNTKAQFSISDVIKVASAVIFISGMWYDLKTDIAKIANRQDLFEKTTTMHFEFLDNKKVSYIYPIEGILPKETKLNIE